ncbi:Bromodomain [Trinorchestia longiramus]|nr:Bromodomain [Trinorchestia longiramus]
MKTSQLDTWSTREQLALVSAVQNSGDQNWVAVSRSIRGVNNEEPRPQDWYNQKNCALQYAHLLETITPAKRKREKDKANGPTTADANSTETPGEMLAKMLTKQHLDELSVVMEKEKQLYHQLRRELQQLEAGHLDHQLELLWEQMVQEEKDDQEQEQKYEVWAKERESTIAAIQLAVRPFKGTVGRRSAGRMSSGGTADDSATLLTPVSATPNTANGNRDEARSGNGGTPSSPLLSSLLTRTVPPHTPPPSQDLTGGSSKGTSFVPSGVVQKLFSSCDADMKVAPRSSAAAASPTLSRLLELPPAVSGQACDVSPSKTRVEASGQEHPTNVNTAVDVGDDKSAVAAAVNGLPTVKLERSEAACGKIEPVDTSSMVIKEDPLIIVNKPETECLQSSFTGSEEGTSKEGYQDSVSSPTIPKQEVKGVWEDDDLKGCGEVLQLGEVQRKYSRLSHASKYHHLFPDEPIPSVKLEKESEEEEDVEEEEEEEDEGFAGFGPSSLSVGSRSIGSVLATEGQEEEMEKQPPGEEEEDVYNIDNDDTIGLKASKQQKLRETAPPKLLLEASEVSSSCSSMMGVLKAEPVVSLGSPVFASGPSVSAVAVTDADDDSSPATATAAKKEPGRKSSRRFRDKCDDKTFDFDDCDSVDSLATTRSSMCGGDSDTGGGGLGSCSSGGGRGSKRKLHPSSDSIFGSSALGSPHNFSDASPESPASTNYGDDLESEKALRSWRKSIMILYNEIAAHKFASVFLRPITEEKVPGYHSVVLRPMDLHTIKRNIESGVIRTTEEFQRDIMLMCINAITYNTKGHNIHDMATSLMNDALAKIEEFQSAAGVVAPESPHKTLRRETRESLAKRSEDSTSTKPTKKKKQS